MNGTPDERPQTEPDTIQTPDTIIPDVVIPDTTSPSQEPPPARRPIKRGK